MRESASRGSACVACVSDVEQASDGRGQAKTMRLVLQPAVEKERWSLYWRTSLETKAELLDPIELDITESDAQRWPVKLLVEHVAQQCEWPSPSSTAHSRMPGFAEPVIRAICNGAELPSGQSLSASGVDHHSKVTPLRDSASLSSIRVVLN